MPDAFLNGAFLDRADARISALDAGMQHSVGLFETMLGGIGPGGAPWAFRLGDHLTRIAASARELGLSDSLRTGPVGDAVLETIQRAGYKRTRARLTITGGDLNMLARGPGSSASPTVLIVAQPATEYPEAMFARGVSVAFADTRANPLNPFESHKTLNYWWRLRQLQAAGARGAAEAIVLQVTNHLCGGCVSNVFLVKEGRLLAPIARGEEGVARPASSSDRIEPGAADRAPKHKPGAYLPSPVLPGIVRGAVLGFAAARKMDVELRMLWAQDLLEADEVFLTNSSWGVLPVTSVIGLGDKRILGRGEPGALTMQFRSDLLAEIEGEASVGPEAPGEHHDGRS